MTRSFYFYGLLVLLLLSATACGGSDSSSNEAQTSPEAQEAGLSQAELENGIGPITKIDLDTSIDAALATQGEGIFTTKCAACHKMDQRYVGPQLGQVMSNRTPEFIMNMMLNPQEMVEKHPEVKAMLGQFMTPMPNQNLTEDDARAILEYLRDNQTEATGATE